MQNDSEWKVRNLLYTHELLDKPTILHTFLSPFSTRWFRCRLRNKFGLASRPKFFSLNPGTLTSRSVIFLFYLTPVHLQAQHCPNNSKMEIFEIKKIRTGVFILIGSSAGDFDIPSNFVKKKCKKVTFKSSLGLIANNRVLVKCTI